MRNLMRGLVFGLKRTTGPVTPSQRTILAKLHRIQSFLELKSHTCESFFVVAVSTTLEKKSLFRSNYLFFSELMLYQLYRANVLFNVIFTKRQLLKCQIKIVERQDLKSTYHIALISWLSKQTHVVRKAIWYFYIVYIVFSTYKQYKYTFFLSI